jgi:hypothetical protein
MADLEMVGPVVGHNVEAEPVFGYRFHLAGQQVHPGRGFGLVGVVDVQVAVPDLAPSPLPNVPKSALWWQCYKTFFSSSMMLRQNRLECLSMRSFFGG